MVNFSFFLGVIIKIIIINKTCNNKNKNKYTGF